MNRNKIPAMLFKNRIPAMLKKLTLLVLGLLLTTPLSIRAGWIDDMKKEAEELLKPLIGDIGAALSGGITDRADTLGFPGGELAIKVTASGISDDNEIIQDTDYIPIPWIAGEVGLPIGINLFLRGFTYKVADSDVNINFIGGGVKYTILEDKTPSPLPGILAVLSYNMLSAPEVRVNTTSLGITVGKKLLFITPYLNLSYNFTRSAIEMGTGITLNPKKDSFRIGGGLELRPFPFVFINGGVNSIDSNIGWDVGIGLRIKSPI